VLESRCAVDVPIGCGEWEFQTSRRSSLKVLKSGRARFSCLFSLVLLIDSRSRSVLRYGSQFTASLTLRMVLASRAINGVPTPTLTLQLSHLSPLKLYNSERRGLATATTGSCEPTPVFLQISINQSKNIVVH